jgi:hypothetical protein
MLKKIPNTIKEATESRLHFIELGDTKELNASALRDSICDFPHTKDGQISKLYI